MHQVSSEEYKSIVLEVLHKIDVICRKHGIIYQIAYGTLLGAVRHGGFIPWDDDVDIMMMRSEYEKLRAVVSEECSDLNFIDVTTDRDAFLPYGKICAADTILFENRTRPVKGYGAYVDVFPLDYLPENKRKRKKICRKAYRYCFWGREASRIDYDREDPRFWSEVGRMLGFHASRFVRSDIQFMKLEAFMKENCSQRTSLISTPYEDPRAVFPSSIAEDLIEMDFEGMKVMGPRDYDTVLTLLYGKDWMTPPPENMRGSDHDYVCYI